MTNKEKLEKFIKDNNIIFGNGNRNTPLVIVCGFCLWQDIEFEEIRETIKDENPANQSHLEDELFRVYNYCEKNNYGNWWEIKTNRNKFITE